MAFMVTLQPDVECAFNGEDFDVPSFNWTDQEGPGRKGVGLHICATGVLTLTVEDGPNTRGALAERAATGAKPPCKKLFFSLNEGNWRATLLASAKPAGRSRVRSRFSPRRNGPCAGQ